MKRHPRKTLGKWLHRRRKQIRQFLAALGVIALIRFFVYPVYLQRRQGLSAYEAEQLIDKIACVFQQYQIPDNRQNRYGSIIEVKIPSSKELDEMLPAIEHCIQESHAELYDIVREPETEQIIISIGRNGKIAIQYLFNIDPAIVEPRARAAIIIDDFGYSYSQVVRSFIFLNRHITLSIIPGLQESKRIAREAEGAGKEYLIHMPMEPQQESYVEDDYILLTKQSDAVIRSRIQKAFFALPAAVGMNNHQGSEFTRSAKMEIAVEEIKKHRKLFIDSRTSSASRAHRLAQRMGVATAANDLFIDAVDDSDFIFHQLGQLVKLSLKKGHAVAIGHVREKTLSALQDFLPEFERNGIELVFVTQIVASNAGSIVQ